MKNKANNLISKLKSRFSSKKCTCIQHPDDQLWYCYTRQGGMLVQCMGLPGQPTPQLCGQQQC